MTSDSLEVREKPCKQAVFWFEAQDHIKIKRWGLADFAESLKKRFCLTRTYTYPGPTLVIVVRVQCSFHTHQVAF